MAWLLATARLAARLVMTCSPGTARPTIEICARERDVPVGGPQRARSYREYDTRTESVLSQLQRVSSYYLQDDGEEGEQNAQLLLFAAQFFDCDHRRNIAFSVLLVQNKC